MRCNRTPIERGWAWALGWGALVLNVTVVGCGRLESSVRGRVTLDGQPVASGTIGFEPIDGGKMAAGQIQSDGSFVLETNDQQGLAAGTYRVMVFVFGPPTETNGQGELLIPRKYISTKTSGLSYEVERGKNEIAVDLKSEKEA